MRKFAGGFVGASLLLITVANLALVEAFRKRLLISVGRFMM